MAIPTITSVTPSEFDDQQTGIVIVGTNFEAVQGAGVVEISDNAVYAAGTKVTQTITSWSDTSITFTAVLGALTPGTRYVWITNNSTDRNVAGFVVTFHRCAAIKMAYSPNIAPSGENTTGQLTPPASGTFGGGRIQDDENPTDATDIGLDQYLEDEWCIKAQDCADPTATYQFRVLINGIPVGTTSVTPQLSLKNQASGDPEITKPTSTGTAIVKRSASGSPSITKPTSTGTARRIVKANGSPSIKKPVSDGAANNALVIPPGTDARAYREDRITKQLKHEDEEMLAVVVAAVELLDEMD